MSRFACVILVVLWLAGPAAGEIAVTLTPAEGAPAGPLGPGFLPATLRVADPNGELGGVARGVSVRRKRGGPTFLYATSIAPKTEQSLAVVLPVVSPQETYTVRLLAAPDVAAETLGQFERTTTLADLAAVERARNALIDPVAYDGWREDLPRWPDWLLRGALLAGALSCLAMAAALFLRRPVLRLAAVAVLAAGGAFAAWTVLAECTIVSVRRAGPITAVACRRTVEWSVPTAGGLAPVYDRPRDLDDDDIVYRPDGTAAMKLQPAAIRLFRQTGGGK